MIIYILVVALIIGIHRHLFEIGHSGRIVVSTLLRNVILRVIDGRRWHAIAQHRIRRQIQTVLHNRSLLRRDVLIGGATFLFSLRWRLVHRDGGVC